MTEIVHQIFASGKGLVLIRFQSDAKVVNYASIGLMTAGGVDTRPSAELIAFNDFN